jgi:hypothetical protein
VYQQDFKDDVAIPIAAGPISIIGRFCEAVRANAE